MNRTLKLIPLAIAIIAMAAMMAMAQQSNVSQKTKVVNEFQISIVQPLEIQLTYQGESKLGPGMSSNFAYSLHNNLEEYVIKVKYSVQAGPHISLNASLYFPAADKSELLGTTGEILIGPGEHLYFIVRYSIADNAPIGTQTSIRVILEETERISMAKG